MRIRDAVGLLLIWAALASCGGGGGSGGGSTPPINSAAGGGTPSVSLAPIWTLETASASELGQTQAEVQSVLDHVFADTATQAALLVLNGYVIGERYAPDRDANSLGHSWSVAKSFYSAAVGVAIDEGWIQSVDQPAADFLTEWQGTAKETITIGNLLEMRSGFAADSSIFFADDQTNFALDFP
ncbi:MAG: serine hydrolase, partial [Pseudomonadota bacterium]